MKNLPSQQSERINAALEKFKQTGKVEMDEPCNCGSRIMHNNGGNYHEWIIIQRDSDKVFQKRGNTCELVAEPEWQEITEQQAEQVIRKHAGEWF